MLTARVQNNCVTNGSIQAFPARRPSTKAARFDGSVCDVQPTFLYQPAWTAAERIQCSCVQLAPCSPVYMLYSLFGSPVRPAQLRWKHAVPGRRQREQCQPELGAPPAGTGSSACPRNVRAPVAIFPLAAITTEEADRSNNTYCTSSTSEAIHDHSQDAYETVCCAFCALRTVGCLQQHVCAGRLASAAVARAVRHTNHAHANHQQPSLMLLEHLPLQMRLTLHGLLKARA